MSDFELTEEKLKSVEECIGLADEWFEKPDCARFGELIWWDDGDFRIVIQHSHGDEEEEYLVGNERIEYKKSDGKVKYKKELTIKKQQMGVSDE